MEKRKYAEDLAKVIAEEYGKVTDVVEVDKPNGVHLVGVTIREEGAFAAPTFYIEDFYEDYSMEENARQIVEIFENCVPPMEGEPDLSYENIKNKLTVRLLNVERNEKYLEKMKDLWVGCGFALIADINISKEYRAPITEDLAVENKYPIELFDVAMENSVKANPPLLFDMTEGFCGDKANLIGGGGSKDGDMYVLTNDEMVNGSVSLFYPGVMEKVKEAVGDNYYVLPSSVHEVIIVPDRTGCSPRDLKKMVIDANRTVVEEPDILSDGVYHYDGKLKVVA